MKNPTVTTTLGGKAREAIEGFVEFVERTRAHLIAAPAVGDPHALRKLTEHFLEETGFLKELRRLEKSPEAAENRARNIKELAAGMDDAGGAAIPAMERLQTFLEEVTLDNEREDKEESAGEAVTLITMHSCKGLEFPHVYVVGLEDGLLPHSRSKVEQTVDEERRLFYVAVTRAMRSLTLSHCASRKKYGTPFPCHPSPFLKELPEDLVEDGDAKGKEPVKSESAKDMFATMRAVLD